MGYLSGHDKKINSLICAPFTPFGPDGNVNPDLIPHYAACLRENGIGGVYVNGSSGEGLLLTEAERLTMVEAWAKQCGPDFKLIVHVGATSVRGARVLAAHARDLGAFAISTIGPTFPPLASVEQLCAYCEEIAEAAPDTPFYYYHIPALSRVDLPMLDLLELARERIPSFAGIKWTSMDLFDMTRCARFDGGRFDILAGLDETMLAALSIADSRGFIGGTFNYCAPIYVQIVAAFRAGNIPLARSLQEASQDIIEVLIKYKGNMVAGKQMMRLIGLDLGPGRTPLPQMSDDQFKQMASDLERVNFFKYCNTLDGQRAGAPKVLAG